MNTKIIYVVISGKVGIYFEQVWASAWSLKRYNPMAHVIVLTDDATRQSIYSDERKDSLNCIDEVRVVKFDKKYSNKEKSRWIKTNIRNLIEGDFLFIDADTIITGDLSAVDSWNCSIGAVLDSHCHSQEITDSIPFQDMYVNRLKKVFGLDYNGEDVFNSGVLYVKDDEISHRFFKTWHENWLHSNSKGYHVDQLSLLKTNMEFGQLIEEIPGEYNCQIRCSIQFLTRAKILHTFASQENSSLSIILGTELYYEIKREHSITSNVSRTLIDCKELFTSPSYLVDKKWMKIRFQPAFQFVDSVIESNRGFDHFLLKMINCMGRVFSYLLRHTK